MVTGQNKKGGEVTLLWFHIELREHGLGSFSFFFLFFFFFSVLLCTNNVDVSFPPRLIHVCFFVLLPIRRKKKTERKNKCVYEWSISKPRLLFGSSQKPFPCLFFFCLLGYLCFCKLFSPRCVSFHERRRLYTSVHG